MIKAENGVFDLTKKLSYSVLREYTEYLCQRYSAIECEYLGESILGRSIPILKLGHGRAKFLYVGTHHGMEHITGSVLLKFAEEYGEAAENGRSVHLINVSYLYEAATIYVVPVLNPDGAEIAINGNGHDPLSERRLKYNSGNPDFSHWQANARGVDLNHNYNCGFYEYKQLEAESGIYEGAPTKYSGLSPESEPESIALCNFIRYHGDVRMLLTLHTQGEEIYSGCAEMIPRANAIGKVIEKMTGYKRAVPEGSSAYGGLTDWFTHEFLRPAYTLECGIGENPLPMSSLDTIYDKLRRLFFTFPIMK